MVARGSDGRFRRKAPPTVAEAVEAALAADPSVASSWLAATAIALARELDSPEASAAAKSSCARQLRETMSRLDLSAERDGLDDLKSKRAARLAGRPKT